MFSVKINTVTVLVIILLSLKGYYSTDPSEAGPSSSRRPRRSRSRQPSTLPLSSQASTPQASTSRPSSSRQLIDINAELIEISSTSSEPDPTPYNEPYENTPDFIMETSACSDAVNNAFGGPGAQIKNVLEIAIHRYTYLYVFDNVYVKQFYYTLGLYAVPGELENMNSFCINHYVDLWRESCKLLLPQIFGNDQDTNKILQNAMYSIDDNFISQVNNIISADYFSEVLRNVDGKLNPGNGVIPYRMPATFCRDKIAAKYEAGMRLTL